MFDAASASAVRACVGGHVRHGVLMNPYHEVRRNRAVVDAHVMHRSVAPGLERVSGIGSGVIIPMENHSGVFFDLHAAVRHGFHELYAEISGGEIRSCRQVFRHVRNVQIRIRHFTGHNAYLQRDHYLEVTGPANAVKKGIVCAKPEGRVSEHGGIRKDKLAIVYACHRIEVILIASADRQLIRDLGRFTVVRHKQPVAAVVFIVSGKLRDLGDRFVGIGGEQHVVRAHVHGKLLFIAAVGELQAPDACFIQYLAIRDTRPIRTVPVIQCGIVYAYFALGAGIGIDTPERDFQTIGGNTLPQSELGTRHARIKPVSHGALHHRKCKYLLGAAEAYLQLVIAALTESAGEAVAVLIVPEFLRGDLTHGAVRIRKQGADAELPEYAFFILGRFQRSIRNQRDICKRYILKVFHRAAEAQRVVFRFGVSAAYDNGVFINIAYRGIPPVIVEKTEVFPTHSDPLKRFSPAQNVSVNAPDVLREVQRGHVPRNDQHFLFGFIVKNAVFAHIARVSFGNENRIERRTIGKSVKRDRFDARRDDYALKSGAIIENAFRKRLDAFVKNDPL